MYAGYLKKYQLLVFFIEFEDSVISIYTFRKLSLNEEREINFKLIVEEWWMKQKIIR